MAEIRVSKTRNPLDFNSFSFDERLTQLADIENKEEKQRHDGRKSPFSRWTQYNNEHTRELMWLTLKHPKAHAILLFLVDQMDKYNAVICSYAVLQEVLSISKSTVHRNIRVLADNGFLTVLKSGTSNVYAINDSVYWKSWKNNRKYSKFPANVVLSLSEQDKDYQQLNLDGLCPDKTPKVKEKSK
jgi:DNA-binding transcriptional ArsR family regulator